MKQNFEEGYEVSFCYQCTTIDKTVINYDV